MHTLRSVGVLLLAAACSTSPDPLRPEAGADSEADYSYPGCPAATNECPKDVTLHCALDAIAQPDGTCGQDSDCRLAPLEPLCSGAGACPPFAVNTAFVANFQMLAQAEIAAYCAQGLCSEAGLCAVPSFRALCDAGRCQGVAAMDGG